MERLTEQMRRTVEEAETTEPLLSKHLYDAIRQTRQQRPGEALEMTRARCWISALSINRAKAEEVARTGIEQLKFGCCPNTRPKACWATKPKLCVVLGTRSKHWHAGRC